MYSAIVIIVKIAIFIRFFVLLLRLGLNYNKKLELWFWTVAETHLAIIGIWPIGGTTKKCKT